MATLTMYYVSRPRDNHKVESGREYYAGNAAWVHHMHDRMNNRLSLRVYENANLANEVARHHAFAKVHTLEIEL